MNHWAFVTAAYALTVVAVGGLALWSWLAMRRAEAAAAALGKRA
jgi:heme exporter protein CcmD